MEELINISKALSDSNRVRTLMALRNGELCVCRIIELLGLAPSTVSKHMSVLRHSGLVESRKEERWIYYRLPDSTKSSRTINTAIEWLINTLTKDDIIIKDALILDQILEQKPETLCKKRIEERKSGKSKRNTYE